MELLSEIWDKTTDAMTSLSEGVSTGLIRLFGNSNERQIKRMRPIVARIGELEPSFEALSDDELRAKTAAFRAASPRVRPWTICFPKRSPPVERRGVAICECGITTSS